MPLPTHHNSLANERGQEKRKKKTRGVKRQQKEFQGSTVPVGLRNGTLIEEGFSLGCTKIVVGREGRDLGSDHKADFSKTIRRRVVTGSRIKWSCGITRGGGTSVISDRKEKTGGRRR